MIFFFDSPRAFFSETVTNLFWTATWKCGDMWQKRHKTEERRHVHRITVSGPALAAARHPAMPHVHPRTLRESYNRRDLRGLERLSRDPGTLGVCSFRALCRHATHESRRGGATHIARTVRRSKRGRASPGNPHLTRAAFGAGPSSRGAVEGDVVVGAGGTLGEAHAVVVRVRVHRRAQPVHRLDKLGLDNGPRGALLGSDRRRRAAVVARLGRLWREGVALPPLAVRELRARRVAPDHCALVVGVEQLQRLLWVLRAEVVGRRARRQRERGAVDEARRVALADELDLVRQRPAVHLAHVPPVLRPELLRGRRRVDRARRR
eukprot:4102134-Prymnesium_polylepis.1